MQILLFLGFMLVLVGVSSLFLLQALRNFVFFLRMKRGQQPRKRFIVFGSIFLVIGIIVGGIPITFFCVIRQGNLSRNADYVDTGIYLEEGCYQDTAFTVEGVQYHVLNLTTGSFRTKRENAVFSYAEKQSLLDIIMGFCNAGNYYAVSNDVGADLVADSWHLFCPTDQMRKVMDWYSDETHYVWYYKIYHLDEDPTAVEDRPILNPNKEKLADFLIFCDHVSGGSNEGAASITVEIPREEQKEYVFSQISSDGLVIRAGYTLMYYNEAFYFQRSVNGKSSDSGEMTLTYTLVPLPKDINNYLSSIVH